MTDRTGPRHAPAPEPAPPELAPSEPPLTPRGECPAQVSDGPDPTDSDDGGKYVPV